MSKQKELPARIQLAYSHVTQHTNDNTKSDWKVRENITSKDLFTLPARLTEAEVFAIMDNVKVFELRAFNAGIDYGKEVTIPVHKKIHKEMSHKLTVALKENERIANILEEHITRDTDGTN